MWCTSLSDKLGRFAKGIRKTRDPGHCISSTNVRPLLASAGCTRDYTRDLSVSPI